MVGTTYSLLGLGPQILGPQLGRQGAVTNSMTSLQFPSVCGDQGNAENSSKNLTSTSARSGMAEQDDTVS